MPACLYGLRAIEGSRVRGCLSKSHQAFSEGLDDDSVTFGTAAEACLKGVNQRYAKMTQFNRFNPQSRTLFEQILSLSVPEPKCTLAFSPPFASQRETLWDSRRLFPCVIRQEVSLGYVFLSLSY
jgi:hypothetical protein